MALPRWTAEEEKILRVHQDDSIEEMLQALTAAGYTRTYTSVGHKRWRMGLTKTQQEIPVWSCLHDKGYRAWVWNSPTGKRVHVGEHRLVMERHIGRELFSDEEVHHKNGVRDDNSLSNLELWSTSQPAGQRIEDKVAWAKAILTRYAPEVLNEEDL